MKQTPWYPLVLSCWTAAIHLQLFTCAAFTPTTVSSSRSRGRTVALRIDQQSATAIAAGGGGFGASSSKKSNSSKQSKKRPRLGDALVDKRSSTSKKKKKSTSSTTNRPFVKSESDALLASLASKASGTCIGKAVANSPLGKTTTDGQAADVDVDPFWELMPSLLSSKFPNLVDADLQRVAGFVSHALDPNLPLEDSIVQDPYRPHQDIHAYMPGLGPTKPFYDQSSSSSSRLELCQQLEDNYDTICQEYQALVADMEADGGKNDRFQSVTSMNYESGWKTLVLFYNGHRIPGFPYHLCPTTTRIMETVPLAGRIAGFNRQQPQTGIPLHSDGNNMWLTCQMGIHVPEGETAYIRVGPETRRWKEGECLLYDTTYEHETMNEHPTQERVVLHVDFFNTLAMTPAEIEVMQYIYSLREEFMKAEGVAKVGAQIL